jgi:hypothetical protein
MIFLLRSNKKASHTSGNHIMSTVNEAIFSDQSVLSRTGIEDREISQTTSHPRRSGPGILSARALPADWAQSVDTLSERLPLNLQRELESYFNIDLSGVRIYIGSQASSLGALALTHGDNIYFAPGHYHPLTLAGRRLIAHEVVHVIQQRHGYARNPMSSGVALLEDAELEEEAERLASAFVTGVERVRLQAGTVRRFEVDTQTYGSVVQPVGGHGG